MNFRVSDLQVLLGFAGRNKTGKKTELQSRALDLVKLNSPAVEMKIKELHNRRYHNQLISRPSNYENMDRPLTDRPISNYDPSINNNYAMRCNPNMRPMPMNQGPTPSYSGKPYLSPMSTQPPYSPYADVKFKDLPFYDIQHILMRPFSLLPDPIERCQESTYTFTLSPQEAHDISVSKDATGNYECHILLRFCILEAGAEQDDNFPPNIAIKVNGKPVPLPNPIPTNRPGIEPKRPSKPVNITSFTKLSPTVTNVISVTWSSSYGRSYAAVLYVARLLSSYTLLQRLKSRGLRSAEHTRAMVIEKLQQGQDSEIATTSLQASLICPLGKLKMQLPCRALTCSHIPCFDALLYIQLNEKKPKWRCPVCDKPALFKSLMLDGLFMDIVANAPAECTDVQFHEDGSWSPIIPVKESKEVKKVDVEPTKKSSPQKSVEVVDISSDSDTDDVWKPKKEIVIPQDADSPPIMFIPPSNPNILSECPTPPITTFTPPTVTSSDFIPEPHQIDEPIPVCLTSTIQPELASSEHLNILPDLMPSASSSIMDPAVYPLYSVTDSSGYGANSSNTFQDQQISSSISSSSENDTSSPYKYFDFYTLLQPPDGDQTNYESVHNELSEKEGNAGPDVIALD